jgi:oxygen-independent coproporphyrinogen-3 oxidase
MDPIGLYIHWPFCRSKCPYCDFNSHVVAGIDQARWRAALSRELAHEATRLPGRTVGSIFFGGGTPSLMEPATVAALIAAAGRHWTFAPDIEITLEANPTSVEAGRFADLRAAGVNRVSLGVQALDDRALGALGRGHDVAEALEAVALARRHFARFSFDLIYARPGQRVADWRAELARALDHAGDHLSVYQLTIEEGTAFAPLHARGELVLPDEDTQADLYEATQEMLEAAGLPAYEISNHARPGAECRHNLLYWRYGDYAGIGPGAHGRVPVGNARHATRRHRAPDIWLTRVEASGAALQADAPIAAEDAATECLMMGLRTIEGVSRGRFAAVADRPVEAFVDHRQLDRMTAGGFIEMTPTHLRATAAGRQRLNGLLAALLPA